MRIDYKISLVLAAAILCLFSPAPGKDQISLKQRLPNTVNSYEKSIVPVVTVDGKFLYFDRKNHPDNYGSINDPDDIWYSRRIFPSDFIDYDSLSVPLLDKDIDHLVRDNAIEKYLLNNGNGHTSNPSLPIDSLSWLEPENAGSPINTPYSDVLFSITPDGNTALVYGIYDNYSGSKTPGFSLSKKKNGRWSAPEPLVIKNYYNNLSQREGYSTRFFYGSLSADCRTLILSLNRMDGHGDLDLYVCFRLDGNEWTEPVNLGSVVNSSSIEAAPYLAMDGRSLYFATNGRNGYGMLDLYVTRRLDDSWTNWSEPQNLGPAINSEFDEKGICFASLGNEAYIISKDTADKRYGIYRTAVPPEFMPGAYYLYNGSFFRLDGANLSYYKGRVTISLWRPGEPASYYSTDNYSNEYFIAIPTGEKTIIKFSAEGMSEREIVTDTLTAGKPQLVKKDILFRKPEVTANHLTLLFDYDDDRVTDSAAAAVKDMVSRIRPRARVLITGHADEQGTAGHNNSLSMRRAKNVAAYLASLGVDPKIIVTGWKGSSQPLSKDLSKNRRVEVIIE